MKDDVLDDKIPVGETPETTFTYDDSGSTGEMPSPNVVTRSSHLPYSLKSIRPGLCVKVECLCGSSVLTRRLCALQNNRLTCTAKNDTGQFSFMVFPGHDKTLYCQISSVKARSGLLISL